MEIIVKDEGGDFVKELPTPGLHNAVYSKVFDLGQQEVEWNNEVKYKHQVMIFWELDQTISDGEYKGNRMLIKKKYTASMKEKANLRLDLESRRGKKFTKEELAKGVDLAKLRGVPCQLNILHDEWNGKEFAKVGTVLPPTPENDMVPELPEDWEPPQFVKDLIAKGFGSTGDMNAEKEKFEDEVPF